MPEHDLAVFMKQVSDDIASEYTRVHSRAMEDPGTAGDEGESKWAEVLRRWIPPAFPVVTKGRILSVDGVASRQVDVLVLHPGYPEALRDRKQYLASGVVAAFECKLTLRKRDLPGIVETMKSVRAAAFIDPAIAPSPRSELSSPIMFGVLAHSSEWSGRKDSEAARVMLDSALQGMLSSLDHPTAVIEVLCVADLVTYSRFAAVMPGPPYMPEDLWEASRKFHGWPHEGCIEDQLSRTSPTFYEDSGIPNPVFVLIGKILRVLARHFPEHEVLGRYWHLTPVAGGSGGCGSVRRWPLDVLSDDVVNEVRRGRLGSQAGWEMGWL